MQEQDILTLYNERDESAIEYTADIYGERLLRFAARLLRNIEEAEECVNDTYLKAWNSIPPVQPHSLSAYLYQLCRYEAFGKLDKQQAAKRHAILIELSDELAAYLPCMTVEDTIDERELTQSLDTFLKTLPKDSRMIFIRRYWFGNSIKEIATRYHISESKVKTSLHRTRNKLRHYLEREGSL